MLARGSGEFNFFRKFLLELTLLSYPRRQLNHPKVTLPKDDAHG
jgi:hypothetical protein